MPSNYDSPPLLTSQISLGGALIGASLGLAYAAVCVFRRSRSISASLSEIQKAPTFRLAALRIFIEIEESDEPLLVLRGAVDAVDCGSSLSPHPLFSRLSRAEFFVIPRTQSAWTSYLSWNHLVECICNAWKDFLGWVFEWVSYLPWNRRFSSPTTIPFIVSGGDQLLQNDCVTVKLMVSRHPLPLTIAYDQLIPSKHTLHRALFHHKHCVGLTEEKILSLGKDIGDFGTSSFNRVPELKKFIRLPYFLTDATKDQMMSDLAFRSKMLFWGGVFLGSISICLLGYSVARFRNKWIIWKRGRRHQHPRHVSVEPTRQQQLTHASIEPTRQQQQPRPAYIEPTRQQPIDDASDGASSCMEPIDGVSDKPLCLICYAEERQVLFIPCRHIACCQQCAALVLREDVPNCPVCREAIQNFFRVYIP